MKLIVGLGNPEKKYEKTRHNLGFMVVERFLKDFEPVGKTFWTWEEKFKSDIARIEWQRKQGELEKVLLVKPKTYMNNSGLAVNLIVAYYKLIPGEIWIIHDEIDLPFGTMKIRLGGAGAGHHGVESIIEHLKTDKFWRFRLGIGVDRLKTEASSKIKNVEDYVLGSFSGHERGSLKKLIKRGSEAIAFALEENLEPAMNRFNSK